MAAPAGSGLTTRRSSSRRPKAVGMPFTRWSLRKLAQYLGATRPIVSSSGASAYVELLAKNEVTFQRTKTGRSRTTQLVTRSSTASTRSSPSTPTGSSSSNEFGPLGSNRSALRTGRRARTPTSAGQRPQDGGRRQFHGCYPVGDDELFGIVYRQKSGANTLAAIETIRRRRPEGQPIFVILGQPLGPQGRADPQLVCRARRRAVLHPHL